MATEAATRVLITAPFRMVFPRLLKAESFTGEKGSKQAPGAPQYTLEALFQNSDLVSFQMPDGDKFVPVDVRRVCVELAKEAWGADFQVKEAVEKKDMVWPVKSGAQKIAKAVAKGKSAENFKHYDGEVSVIGMKAYEDYPPSLIYPAGREWKQIRRGLAEDESKARVYFGQAAQGHYARAEVKLRTSEVNERKFITFYMNRVTYLKAGETIAGGGSMMDRFLGTQGGASDHDPTSGMDDEIPF